jgi:hypothetical protein
VASESSLERPLRLVPESTAVPRPPGLESQSRRLFWPQGVPVPQVHHHSRSQSQGHPASSLS